ncbi:MAG: deoxyribonuclease IV [Lachnospiraceae bacterium]|nr:deoxyribonuclease IV [Lachnospiraceae bacterium]
MLLGSHVGMSGKEMFAGSVKEALSYGANTFMVYTGAPQNTRRKSIDELNIPAAHLLMKEHGIDTFIVHAPYIINLGNPINEDTYKLAVDFLAIEIERTAAMGSQTLVLHPGSHVGEGVEAGLSRIIDGLNSVLTADTTVNIALETMAGKGSEIGRTFEELKAIFDGVKYNDKLRVCFDTCHVNDAGYDIVNNFDEVVAEFDKVLGIDKIAAIHINDSKNELNAHKDRHENFGFGNLGFDALLNVINYPAFENVPKILETPYVPSPDNKKTFAPYGHEIAMIKSGKFDPLLKEKIIGAI